MPSMLYVSKEGKNVNGLLEARTREAGKDCQLIVVPGDYLAMVAPSVQQAIAWFQSLAASN